MKTQTIKSGKRQRRIISACLSALAFVTIVASGFAQAPVLTLIDYSRNNGATIQIQGTTGETYTIQYISSIEIPPPWTNLGTIMLTGTNIGQMIDSGARLVSQRYYRAVSSNAASANVVGFLHRVIPPGYSMLAEPFEFGSNIVTEIFPTVPDGSCLWNPSSGSWELNCFAQGKGWFNPAMTLPVGVGFWFYNAGAAVEVTFKGSLANLVSSSRNIQGLSMCSFPGPVSWNFLGCLVPTFGSLINVFVLNPVSSNWEMYTFDPEWGEWGVQPDITPGQPFYLYFQGSVRTFCETPWWVVAVPVSSGPGITLNPFLSGPRVFDEGGQPLSGCGFKGALYLGQSNASEDELVMRVPSVCFGTNGFAGYAPILLGNLNPDYLNRDLWLQFRVWEGNDVGSYEEAVNLHRRVGKSGPMQVRAPASLLYLPTLVPGCANFSICSLAVPSIDQQPQSQIVSAGRDLTLSVQAGASEPFSYQWRLNGAAISWATNAVLTLTNVQCANLGIYSVVLSNTYGSVTSSPAALSLTELELCSAVKVCGTVGSSYRVEWADAAATNSWQLLTNVTLPYSPFTIIDLDSTRTHKRLYRTIAAP